MKINIIGTDYIEFVSGARFPGVRNNVICVDIDAMYIQKLQKDIFLFMHQDLKRWS